MEQLTSGEALGSCVLTLHGQSWQRLCHLCVSHLQGSHWVDHRLGGADGDQRRGDVQSLRTHHSTRQHASYRSPMPDAPTSCHAMFTHMPMTSGCRRYATAEPAGCPATQGLHKACTTAPCGP